jgi:DNA-binding Xre family transcriptional regulator
MIRFDLRKALLDYQARTGIKMSYEDLSSDTDISVETIKSIATRENYNATLRVLSTISESLGIDPIDYLNWEVNDDRYK